MAVLRRGNLLFVDHENESLRTLCTSLNDLGFGVQRFNDPNQAIDTLRSGRIDIVLGDLMIPAADDVPLLTIALKGDPNLIGIDTAHETKDAANEAIKRGAFDYLLKPFLLEALLPLLDRAMDVRRLKLENHRLRRFVEQWTFNSPRFRIVGNSPAIRKVADAIEKLSLSDVPVLVIGPSGSGKELAVRVLHFKSARRDKPLVTVNCGTLQEGLLESELFGHEKGAFTGADRDKIGLFEVADGGMLFIDEVAEMPLGMQAKLVRVLENGRYRRVGGTTEQTANVRVVASTSRPLEEEVRAGRFREDLFDRLKLFAIELPPLRSRREDIPLLVEHFLSTRQIGKTPFTLSAAAMSLIVNYHWPGNVRELANVLERAQIVAEGSIITRDDLPENLVVSTATPATGDNSEGPYDLESFQRRHVEEVLARWKGNKLQAAKALGISRRALYRLIEKYGLGGPRSTET